MGQQLLLTPLPLELTAPERITLEEELSDLASFGYEIEPFGQEEFLLRAVPASLSGFDPLRLLRSALSEREKDCRSSTVREAGSRIAARIACHAAIKVNFELAPEKMRYLVRELWRARQPTVCPHGRPTTLRIGREQNRAGIRTNLAGCHWPKEIRYGRWSVYYAGRALELAGLLVVSWAMVVFFGSRAMRPMLAVTGVGMALFILGWLLARRNPES